MRYPHRVLLVTLTVALSPACALIANLGRFDGAVEADAGSASGDDGAWQDVDADSVVDGSKADVFDAAEVESSSACNPTVAVGAASTPGGYQSILGQGGYTFAFDDRAGGSSCIAPQALCGEGITPPASAADWGAAIGFSLGQAMYSGAPSNPYAVPSNVTGISVLLSNLPPSIRVAIDHGGVEYCATLPSAVATVKWSAFNSECWNNQGQFLSGPPADATFIHFIVPALAASRTFDFCVISLAFVAGPESGDGATDATSTEDAAPDGASADATAESVEDGGPDGASLDGAAD